MEEAEECVSLLPGVCEVLAGSGSSLPDDTSLEKLLDWFTELSSGGRSLLDSCPCLLDLVSSVVQSPDPDPGLLSFALRLAGLLGSSAAGFRTLQDRSVLDLVFTVRRWQDSGLWEDPCLRIGWVQGLRNLLQHPEALRFVVKSGFMDQILRLQTDSSLFVASAVNHVLAHILVFFQPGEDPVPDYTAALTAVTDAIRRSLPPKNSQVHQSLQVLRLLAQILVQAGPALRDQLIQKAWDSLETAVEAGHSELAPPLMDVVLAAHSSGADDQRVARLVSAMLDVNKRPRDLLRAAAAFLGAARRDPVNAARAARILLLPLDVVTDQDLLGSHTGGTGPGPGPGSGAEPGAEDEELRSALEQQLRSRSSCCSLVCVSVTHTPQVALMPSGIRPCAPELLAAAVVSLLRICSGNSSSSSSSSSSCREASRSLVNSGRVQKSCLEALEALASLSGGGGGSGGTELLADVFTVLLEYLDSPDSEPAVLQKSFQALLMWTRSCPDVSFVSRRLGPGVLQVVRKRACDVRWEVRDSTLEFVGQLADSPVLLEALLGGCSTSGLLREALQGGCSTSGLLREALQGGCSTSGLLQEALQGACSTSGLLREALQDTESYVRASAVSALAKTLTHSWQQGAALSEEEVDLVSRLLDLLSQDSEGFPRRAVVCFFITWFSSSSSSSSSSPPSLLMRSLPAVLSRGSADLDWEVKVHTLELAELLLDEAFSGRHGNTPPPNGAVSPQTHRPLCASGGRSDADVAAALGGLVQQGVVSALLAGLVDCDRPVALKACRLLMALRDAVGPASTGTPGAVQVSCELPGRGWGPEVRRMLRTEEDGGEDGSSAGGGGGEGGSSGGGGGEGSSSAGGGGGEGGSSGGGGGEGGSSGGGVSVCELLIRLRLDARLDVLSRSSDHVHNSPLSLLQDIVAASAAHKRPASEDGDEVVVDCY